MSPAEAALDCELRSIVEDPQRPLASLSVHVLRRGQTAYEGQWGRRHISPDRPANERTLYRVASISKLVTTLGVLRLLEAGRLKLDDDISATLGYELRNPHFPRSPITWRMLLTHTSSLRDSGGYFWNAAIALKDVLVPGGMQHGKGEMWAKDHAPGTWFQYANLPWGVVGTAMERITGERFDRLMQRLVLSPLGLSGSFNPAELSREALSNLATLYRKRTEIEGREVWNAAGPWVAQVDDYDATPPVSRGGPEYKPGTNGTLFAPQGGLRASARDLAIIARMLIAGGELDRKRFLDRATVDQMLATHWRFNGANGSSGYGTHEGKLQAWGLGAQHFLDHVLPAGADRLVEDGGFRASGHHGDAWGLTGTLAFDRASGDALIFLHGGPGFDPETTPGAYSAYYRHEERIMTALHRAVIRGKG